jgi:hypothetical protein
MTEEIKQNICIEKKCNCKVRKIPDKKYVNKSYLLPSQIEKGDELKYKLVKHKGVYNYFKKRDKPLTPSFIRYRINKFFTKTEDIDLLLKIYNEIKIITENYKPNNIDKPNNIEENEQNTNGTN